MSKTKLLLTGVFKPFGVSDEYGEALCTMELLNNQVTREQGIHSPRQNNPSFGLYLLAENILTPATVLDFPTWKEFTKEVRNGNYTHVGISFIVPNVLKAARMANYVRKHSPATKILLGGHGAAIPNLKNHVDYDEVCRGEGVRWLRTYFNEPHQERPIIHPVVPSSVRKYIYGAPVFDKGAIILPGVGCQNSCRFCATAHKFEKQYTSFLREGGDLFAACRKSETAMGTEDFSLMDENFCKMPVRAAALLAEMEAHKKAYTFSIFSSAEAITRMGVDFLVRMGVNFVWIGVESKWNVFEKTQGVDLHALIKDIQDHGITVLASTILFMEHHDRHTIEEDIDWAIGLESDMLQFMQFGPIPGTRLYNDYEVEGKLLMDIPYPEQHGQDKIWFHHPNFTLQDTSRILKEAFERKYETHGPGILSMAHTAVRGYLRLRDDIEFNEKNGLAWDPKLMKYVPSTDSGPDEFLRLRLESWRQYAIRFRPMFRSTRAYAPNQAARDKADMVAKLYEEAFGKMDMKDIAKSAALRLLAWKENLHLQIRKAFGGGDIMRQPATVRQEYADRRGTITTGHDRKKKRPHSSATAAAR
ncbi:MAG: radical SAM protein [Nitrospinae bacterium]|nr:radical SAM protein [Nitrospinota bacterium]